MICSPAGMGQQGYSASGYQNMGPTAPGGMMEGGAPASMSSQPGFNAPYQGSGPQGQGMSGMMTPQGQSSGAYMGQQHPGPGQFPPTSRYVTTY